MKAPRNFAVRKIDQMRDKRLLFTLEERGSL
jgi:hypothetical protein